VPGGGFGADVAGERKVTVSADFRAGGSAQG
jgi:hypothetical protein